MQRWQFDATLWARSPVSTAPGIGGEQPVGQAVALERDAVDDHLALLGAGACPGGQARDRGDRQRSAAATPLLAATEEHRLEPDRLPDHQHAHTAGPSELVPAQRHQVGRCGQLGDVEPGERLHRVGVEDRAGRLGVDD